MEYNSIDRVNASFEKQIRHEIKITGYEKNCLSYWDQQLFNISLNLLLEDWKKIRTAEYWEQVNRLKTEIEKKAFLLTSIKNYLEAR